MIAWVWALSDEKEAAPIPGGRSRELNRSEIHYCLAEAIRVDAAKSVASERAFYGELLVEIMMADFDARCGEYRYDRTTMESVRSSVEKRRSKLEVEGRARLQ